MALPDPTDRFNESESGKNGSLDVQDDSTIGLNEFLSGKDTFECILTAR